MKYLFNLVCLFIAQKTYSAYMWLCSETLPTDCDYTVLSKKIRARVKIFKAFLDATRLRQFPTDKDKAKEEAILKSVEGDLHSIYNDKTVVHARR